MRAIDLFRISYGGTLYLLTSSAKQQTHSAETYEPAAVARGGAQIKGELSKSNFEVRLALGHELSGLLLTTWDETPTTITVFSKRTSGTEVIWKGRLASIQPDDTHVKMTFESIYTSMRRPGLRARFQKVCRHPLYGRGCWLNSASFAVAGTLNAITGLVLTVPEAGTMPNGWYAGGMVREPGGILSYISEHTGSSLTLNRVSSALAAAFESAGAGLAITLYPGCDHSYATCQSKFANDDNYGGFDYIPVKNPMGGSSIV